MDGDRSDCVGGTQLSVLHTQEQAPLVTIDSPTCSGGSQADECLDMTEECQENDADTIFDDGLTQMSPCSETYLSSSSDEDDTYMHPKCVKCLTTQELVVEGLKTGIDALLEVKMEGIAGRGVIALKNIDKGAWLCEYKASVYPAAKKSGTPPPSFRFYDMEGSYIITSHYPVIKGCRMCWDATRKYHQFGRYMNHAINPNAKLSAPANVRGKRRIGFVALRDIAAGDEVVWDYGVRGEVEWGRSRLVNGVLVGPGMTEGEGSGVIDEEEDDGDFGRDEDNRPHVCSSEELPGPSSEGLCPQRSPSRRSILERKAVLSSEEEFLTPVTRRKRKAILSSDEDEDVGKGKIPTRRKARVVRRNKKKKWRTPSPVFKDYRKYHFCPYKQCQRAVKKLSQHLQYRHPHLTKIQRRDLCSRAKVARGRGDRKEVIKPITQKTLLSFLPGGVVDDSTASSQDNDGEEDRDIDVSDNQSCGREITKIDISGTSGCETPASDAVSLEKKDSDLEEIQVSEVTLDHPWIADLKQHLMTRHGKGRSEDKARHTCADTCKYFNFVGRGVVPSVLYDATMLNRYLKNLEVIGRSASLQHATLCRIRQAFAYVYLSLDSTETIKADKCQKLMTNWSTVLGKESRRIKRGKLEDMSERAADHDLSEIDKFISNEQMISLGFHC